MAHLALIVGILAFAGAIVSWIADAVFYLRTLRALSTPQQPRLKWLAVVTWPFARARLQGDASVYSGKVNKALVAFFTCLTVAVAATSAATNLSRLSR
jgi:hypothetical protein